MLEGMPATPPLEITLLPGTAAADEHLMAELTQLVNRVYRVAEDGLWTDGAARTTADEMAEMVAAEQVAVARVGGDVVGSVRVQRLGDDTGELGMLVADPERRGEGIGRELVAFAEDLSRRQGLSLMQLELLVPRAWTHPTKEFLHTWYTRIGYRPVRRGTIDDSYPRLAPLLATPCDFVVYHKDLGPGA
jgi:GNAT superfamily N-acetyltransferase